MYMRFVGRKSRVPGAAHLCAAGAVHDRQGMADRLGRLRCVCWDDNRRHIVPMGLWSCVDPGGSAPVPLINQPEIDMSADKDRGIRREKQKRAKELKRQAKQQKQGTPEQSTSKG